MLLICHWMDCNECWRRHFGENYTFQPCGFIIEGPFIICTKVSPLQPWANSPFCTFIAWLFMQISGHLVEKSCISSTLFKTKGNSSDWLITLCAKTAAQHLIKKPFWTDWWMILNTIQSWSPGAHRSTAFHPLFDLRLPGIITIQGFHPSGQWATVGRRNLREKIQRAKLGGPIKHKGIKAFVLFKRTS